MKDKGGQMNRIYITIMALLVLLTHGGVWADEPKLPLINSNDSIEFGQHKLINVKSYGAKGDGITDDTDAINTALKKGGIVYFPDGVYMIKTANNESNEYGHYGEGIQPVSNSMLLFSGKAKLKAIPNQAKRYSVIRIHDVDNIIIKGAIIEGDRSTEDGAHGMGIDIRNSRNISIDSCKIFNCLGDGIDASSYEADKLGKSICHNISIINTEIFNCRRQGITLGGVQNAIIQNCNIHDMYGVNPQSGIDIETNYPAVTINDDIKIENTIFSNNANYDIVIAPTKGKNIQINKVNASKLFINGGIIKLYSCNITNGFITAASKAEKLVIYNTVCHNTENQFYVPTEIYNSQFINKNYEPKVGAVINTWSTLKFVDSIVKSEKSSKLLIRKLKGKITNRK